MTATISIDIYFYSFFLNFNCKVFFSNALQKKRLILLDQLPFKLTLFIVKCWVSSILLTVFFLQLIIFKNRERERRWHAFCRMEAVPTEFEFKNCGWRVFYCGRAERELKRINLMLLINFISLLNWKLLC